LTAFAREVDRERFLAAGFQAVVTKPVLEPRGLERVIEQVLAWHAPARHSTGDEGFAEVMS
jgi:CheY-like chemotaxis protein